MAHRICQILVILACAVGVAALSACKAKPQVESISSIAGDPPIEWRLTSMQGTAVAATPPVTLRLTNDGAMSGKSFVNNYFGKTTITGSGTLLIGEIGSTMMAASPELMDSEQTYFKLLNQVNRFTTSGDTLTLLHNDEPLLVFTRHASPP